MEVRGFEIATADCEVNVFELANGFELDDDFSLNNKVQPVFADLMISIKQRDRMLSNELDATQRKFDG